MTTAAQLSALDYRTMPRDQGQIVTVSYAADWEAGILARRVFDASDRSTSYYWAEIDEDNERDFEPQNGGLPMIDGGWTLAASGDGPADGMLTPSGLRTEGCGR